MYTPLFCLTLFSLSLIGGALGQTSYANDFVDPDYIVDGRYPANTGSAQRTLRAWATTWGRRGPWSVMDKNGVPPSGSKHDFLSWAPYWWPDCSGVGNTTRLTDEQIWTTCPYVRRDGQFNPDVRNVNDVGNFQDMSEAVFYNTLAWALDKTPSNLFSQNAVRFLRTWFLDEATRMNPNLNYGQIRRGPDRSTGSPTGVLDLKGMAKIASAILLLRKGGSTDWTSALDTAFVAWCRDYIRWLETNPIALEEASAENNHGTFYYNQLAALKLIVNDNAGASTAVDRYFTTQFRAQIAANGEQPLEVARTRPYHYRAYNLAAMITNARIAQYANSGSRPWNRTTSAGATIKTALDHAMSFSADATGESEYAAELHPSIAAVASVYGDPQGRYLEHLKSDDSQFAARPYFVWNQPFAPNEGSALPSTTPRGAVRTATGASNVVTTRASETTKASGGGSKASSLDEEDSAAFSLAANLWLSIASVVVGLAFSLF